LQGWKKLIVVGLALILASAPLIIVLSLAAGIECISIECCPRPPNVPLGQWYSCFVMPYHFHALGFDVSGETNAYLMGWLLVFMVLGASLIVAGLMMKGGKTHSNRSSA
jgi:hypothetical protein